MKTQPSNPLTVSELRVRTADGRAFRFSQSFHIGREQGCDVQIQDVHVSRRHARVSIVEGTWCVSDLQSANGVFANGVRVETASIDGSLTISLGADGPTMVMELEPLPARQPPPPPPRPQPPPPVAQVPDSDAVLLASYAERYFGSAVSDEGMGGRTLMIRRAFEQVQKKQKRKYRGLVAVVALVALCAGGYAYYAQRRLDRQQALALDLFYAMKSIDVSIAGVEQRVAESGRSQDRDQIGALVERRRQLENNYDQFLAGLYDRRLSEQDRLILRVTRRFGECELAAPPEYVREVALYIRKWQSTKTFAEAVKTAESRGYTKKIAEEFLGQDLPPQFFYLALRESGFNPVASGPQTRMGFAKGMWQFIPDTGRRYGLRIGPLEKLPRPDLADDRHDWEKATHAAARYIKDIYATDAQASGLLVMASYNWGENRVINLLRTMPANPKERNFWKLLEKYRGQLPSETYDYVFYIVSAAVIGENPRLFGLPFDNPLAGLDRQN